MKKHLLKIAIVSFFLICSSVAVSAASAEYLHPYKLNKINDGILLTGGIALTGSAVVCGKLLNIKDREYKAEDWKKSDIITFDQIFMMPYNKPLDILSTGTLFMSLASPAVLALLPSSEWSTLGVMYGESLFWAYGIKEWSKLLINRARPYMYYEDGLEDRIAEGDWNDSTPSGHTTGAFTSAAFLSYTFCQYYPDSKWKYGVVGLSFGLAATTGILRMASGSHFFSDVLAGAMIGTISGFMIPYMHTEIFYSKFRKKDTSLYLTPMGFNLEVKF